MSMMTQYMNFEQPDKWMMINDLLAKDNLQLIDIQGGSGPVESSVVAVIYMLLREVQIGRNKLNHAEFPELNKLEKDLENSK